MKILVVNAGSSSLKYQLIDMDGEKVIAKGLCERIGIDGKITHKTADGKVYESKTAMPNHTEAFYCVKFALTESEAKAIDSLDEIGAIGHRVVQGGAVFSESVVIDESVIKGIEELSDLAPLHNPPHVQGIRACIECFGKDVPEVAVFDTAFHSTMPETSYLFALPYEYYEKYKIRRYGFHGTSHRYVSKRYFELTGENEQGSKIITCHLGNGSSITAVKDGKCYDTSMGLTPLDGFIMGTRTGTLDPSVVTYIMEKERLDANSCPTFSIKNRVCTAFRAYRATTVMLKLRQKKAITEHNSQSQCSVIKSPSLSVSIQRHSAVQMLSSSQAALVKTVQNFVNMLQTTSHLWA